jgi:hypothetical protein
MPARDHQNVEDAPAATIEPGTAAHQMNTTSRIICRFEEVGKADHESAKPMIFLGKDGNAPAPSDFVVNAKFPESTPRLYPECRRQLNTTPRAVPKSNLF